MNTLKNSTCNKLFEVLLAYAKKGLSSPSLRELADKINVSSTSTVRYHLNTLREERYIDMKAFQTRSIRVLKGMGIPLLGNIAAGQPMLNMALDVGEIPFPPFSVNQGESDLFALKVRGDSMIGAAICDGDYAIIRRQVVIENGEIAAVLIEGEGTLKRVFYTSCGIELRAENPKYSPIVLSRKQENLLAGKMVALVRYGEEEALPVL